MMWITLLEAKDYIIDMHDVLFWLGAIGVIVSFVKFVVKPIKTLLDNYNAAFKNTEDILKEHKDSIKALSAQHLSQKTCWQKIEKETKQITEDVRQIQAALVGIARLELDKEIGKALETGWISPPRLKWIEEMYDIYKPLKPGNGLTVQMDKIRKLPHDHQVKI